MSTTTAMVSPGLIIRGATTIAGDEEFKRFNRGWYMSRIQQTLSDLNMMTRYQKTTLDFPMPESLRLDPGTDFFDVAEMYAFNREECCAPSDFHEIVWKKRMNNKGSSTSYSSKVGENRSAINQETRKSLGVQSGAMFANEQNGIIMLSPSCSSFDSVRLVGHGFGGIVCDEPIIPVPYRSYIEACILERFFAAKTSEDPRVYRILWADWRSIKAEEYQKVHNFVVTMPRWKFDSFNDNVTDIDVR